MVFLRVTTDFGCLTFGGLYHRIGTNRATSMRDAPTAVNPMQYLEVYSLRFHNDMRKLW